MVTFKFTSEDKKLSGFSREVFQIDIIKGKKKWRKEWKKKKNRKWKIELWKPSGNKENKKGENIKKEKKERK